MIIFCEIIYIIKIADASHHCLIRLLLSQRFLILDCQLKGNQDFWMNDEILHLYNDTDIRFSSCF